MNSAVLLAGATGLIGSRVAKIIDSDRSIPGPVVMPVRREIVGSGKIVPVVDDLSGANGGDSLVDAIRVAAGGHVEAYVSCLGTTMKKAGSESAFLAVDRDLVLRFAQIAKDLGAKHAILVSSVGASASSGNFYLRVKGEVEKAFFKLGFTRADVLRPGLLLGRRNESRPGERFAQLLAPAFNVLLVGSLRRYRAIEADHVAAAIVELVRRGGAGRVAHEYDSIRELARAG